MDIVRSVLPDAPRRSGRHRAARRPGRMGRAALAAVAVGAPVVPSVLLAAPAHADTDWDKLAQCESSGDWSTNTGNGFSGGLQFTPSTWKAFGGSGSPQNASREEQIQVAERVKAEQGMNAWPTCSKKTGQTDDSPNSDVPSTSKGSDDSKSSDDKSSDDSTTSDSKGSDDTSTKSDTKTTTDDTPSVQQTSAPTAGSYTVKTGDTLSSIAASQGTTWRALAQGNPDILTDPNLIFPGQTLSMA